MTLHWDALRMNRLYVLSAFGMIVIFTRLWPPVFISDAAVRIEELVPGAGASWSRGRAGCFHCDCYCTY